ncbi:ATP-dependent DNA helicase [Aeromonas caviae]|uniref:ATP-dependent RecD-like DNA helicase n=1 Tax=Aeromonas caviae TaxID=648 RepID=A0AAJ5ZFR8_AERCA|nr:ATP-dependent RecD-like DNA helicase [Aeromonas caviae]RWT75349.1 hypothetical protein DN604_12170 [Aeromonas caviae]WFG00247.1 ATP-dependent RecD-like DNA helicase [Aeromonas caviae]
MFVSKDVGVGPHERLGSAFPHVVICNLRGTMKTEGLCSIEVSIKSIRYFNPSNRFIIFDSLFEAEPLRLVGYLPGEGHQPFDPSPFLNAQFIVHGTWEDHQQYGRQYHFSALVQSGRIDRVQLQRYCFTSLPSATAEQLYRRFGFYLAEAITRDDRELHELLTLDQLSVLRKVTGSDSPLPQSHTVHATPCISAHEADKKQMPHHLDSLPEAWQEDILKHPDPESMVADLHAWYLQHTQAWLNPPLVKEVEHYAKHFANNSNARGLSYLYGVLRHHERNGNTMMQLDDAVDRCRKYVGNIPITDIDPQFFAIITLNGKPWIQRAFIHSIISTLSHCIAGIIKTKPKETYPPFSDDGLDSSQLAAVNMAMNQPISIITGGPGTGKTYVVKKVVSAMNLGDSDVLLLALAGKSAQRLSDSTGIPASTIHSALQLSNNNRLDQAKHMLPNAKLVVIDEVSTIGILVFYRLIMSLSLLDPLPKIVLLGDSNQLESIEMGSVLQSLIDGGVGCARLEVDHRTSNDFRNLVEGCLGGELNLKDPAIQTITATTPQALLDLISVYAGRIPAAYNIDLIHRYQLLAPTYSGPLGIDNLNLVCQQALNANPFFESPSQFKPGDKVQLTQNTSLYKNGEIGQITSCQNGFLKIQLPNRFVIARPDDVELAYVLSVHKFIGSEADVIVYISEFLTPFERDVSQTYTMATRAKLALYIMTTTDESTVKLTRGNVRQCNFATLLRSAICE